MDDGQRHPGRYYEVLPDPEAQGRFRVYGIESHEPHSDHGLTKTQATRQFRLMEGLARGWQPTGMPSNLHPVPGAGGRESLPGRQYGNG